MQEVSDRTGARLLDFAAAGAQEVRGSLFYPRNYFVSNAYFHADLVINLANLRSHADMVLSGAIKNMFGMVIGKRKALIHHLFRNDPSGFGRALADIHRVVRPHLSFLDLTSVLEGHGLGTAIRPVGVLLASTDAVALDAVAAQVIGYDKLKIWTTHHAERLGLGCSDLSHITVRHSQGVLPSARLKYPALPTIRKNSIYDRVSNFANNTFLRPRPVIEEEGCTGCGKCAERCPARCIRHEGSGLYRIDLKNCADCGCCLKVCEDGAISSQFLGIAKLARLALGKSALTPSISEQIRSDVIRHLINSQSEQTVGEVVSWISANLNKCLSSSCVNELLDDLVVQGLATKTDSGGHCCYRWVSFAANAGPAPIDSADMADESLVASKKKDTLPVGGSSSPSTHQIFSTS